MAKQVHVGFIGAGNIARAHAHGILAAGGKILGAVDQDLPRARDFAHQFSADFAANNPAKLLKLDRLDAVLVCSPNAFHAPHAIAALQAGKHVFCEKPMAVSAPLCQQMIQTARRARRLLTIGYCRRFMPGNELIKSKIETGELGNVYYAESRWFRRRGAPGLGGWFTTKKLSGGGPLIDLGCHMLDLVLWFLGHPRAVRVSAVSGCHLANRQDYCAMSMWAPPKLTAKPCCDVEDYASAIVRFANGTNLLLQTSWAINMPDSERIETWLAGDKAGCVSGNKIEFVGQDGGGLTNTVYQVPEHRCFEHQMFHFLDCVGNGAKPRVKAEEALMVQKILDAVYQSSRLKREIVIR
ncbi:MAG: Gfo/Idh/MocA family oxidoreductase [Phycisphaerae bacterium]|nr:Gfo/Idh/MocA family oxidoreductase [Phycisphaerae bacterium]